jgi:hypothetical protein
MQSKKNFTLLEILVALFLIGFVGAVVGKGCYELFSHYQYKMGVQKFSSDIRQFQMFAMTHGCDVECKLQKEKGEYKVLWRPDIALLEPKKLYYPLKGVDRLSFSEKDGFLEFTIFSTGRISFSSPITFFSKKKSLSLDLLYPLNPPGESVKQVSLQMPSYPELKKK